MNAKPKFFIYARKSTDDATRQQRSIDDQLAEVHQLAQQERLEIVREFTERESAKRPGRPVFNQMLKLIEKGEANGILAWHPDRLARNALDGGRVLNLIDLGRIQALRFPTFRFETTAQGKFMLMVMFGQSKYYSDNLGENILRGKRQKIASGIWPQAAPLGYTNDRTARTVVPDPVQGPLIRKMFEFYATGRYSFEQLRDTLVSQGLLGPRGKPPSLSKINHALCNPFYYGLMRYMGEFYAGKHEALIDKELFERCRLVMNDRGRRKVYRHKHFAYRGMMRCGECGGTMTLEVQFDKYRYVRCTKKLGPCTQKFLREEELTKLASRALMSIAMNDQDAEEVMEIARAEAQCEAGAIQAEQIFLREEIARCDERLNLLLTTYLDRVITIDEYREAKNRLLTERAERQLKAANLAQSAAGWLESFSRLVTLSREAGYAAVGEDCARMGEILKSVGSKWTLRDRRLKWEPRGPWQVFADESFAEAWAGGNGTGLACASVPKRSDAWKRRGGDSNPR